MTLGAEFDESLYTIHAIITTTARGVYSGWVREEDFKNILRGKGSSTMGILRQRNIFRWDVKNGLNELSTKGPGPQAKISTPTPSIVGQIGIDKVIPTSKEAEKAINECGW